MNKIYFKDLEKYFDQNIIIEGFVDNIRDLQYVQFIVLRDSTGKVQVTIEKNETKKELNDIVSDLTIESTVKVSGKLLQNEKVKLGGKEIIPTTITITSKCLGDLPINYKDSESALLDTRLDNRFIDLRSDKNILMFKIQSALVQAMREFLYNNNFTEIHTPKLIGAASESGADVFEVKYFDRLAFLAQSPQFYKQMAMASGFERIFEVAPCFRAEKSYTSKHATEFTSFDLELSYIDSYEDVMKLEEEMLTYALDKVKGKYDEQIRDMFNIEIIVPKTPFPRIKLHDLYKVLETRYGYNIPSEDNGDMNAEGERLASKYAMEEYGSEFIFITDYSAKKRAFYHMRKDGIPQGFDLIWRGVEITTGAQREHRYEILKEQALEKGLAKDVEFYLEFFKYGCPPHGGLAVGIDRLTMLLLNISTVKESMFLFRGPTRLNP